jgi:integrase
MTCMRKPYLIYKRTVKSKKYFYVKIWDEKTYDYSIRKSALSIKDELGPIGSRFPHTSKAGADALVQLWLKEKPKEISQDRLDQYLLSFWEEGSDFLKGQALRGKTYSTLYIKNNHSGVENYLLEFLDDVNKREILLHQVKPDLLESFLNYMTDKGKVGTKRINDILQAVKVALSEAYRLGKIDSNPGAKVRKLQSNSSERKIFSKDEAKSFLGFATDPRQYAINLVAATAGLRLGECRGLLHEDVKDGYIEVRHNWQDGEGLKEPKWGSSGQVPIPPKTQKVLSELIAANPYGNNFVFWGSDADIPISKRMVSDYYNGIVEEKMKITDRVKRGLTFHAWRHYYTSGLRGKISDHALRSFTRHSNEDMTERYTHITEETKRAVSELADKII